MFWNWEGEISEIRWMLQMLSEAHTMLTNLSDTALRHSCGCVKSVILWWEFGAILWWCVAEHFMKYIYYRSILHYNLPLHVLVPLPFFRHSFNIHSSQEPSTFITSSYYLYYFSFQFSSPFSMVSFVFFCFLLIRACGESVFFPKAR